MTPERIVTFFMPVFAAVSGVVVDLIAKYFPGAPHLDRAALEGFFGAGFLAALTVGLKWMHERGKQNARKGTT
jgi:hypothetical protein